MTKLELIISTDDDCLMQVDGTNQPESIRVLIRDDDLDSAILKMTYFLSRVEFRSFDDKKNYICDRMKHLIKEFLKEVSEYNPNQFYPFNNPLKISVGGNQFISVHELSESFYDFTL